MSVESTDARILTLEEFERLPEDEEKLELVEGILVREPPPAPLHGRVQIRLARILDEFVDASGSGVCLTEVGFVLSEDPPTVRAPDLSFVSTSRIPDRPDGGDRWHGAPDLAVEIVSPSSRVSEMQKKVLDHLDGDAREVWVVDPEERTVSIHRSGGEARLFRESDELTGGDLLPEFRLPLEDLFAL